MARIVSVHSFRGGTGKSNTVANVAALLAAGGRRVGVVDTDIQSPGIHVLFGQHSAELPKTLNDYLWGRAKIAEAAYDVTPPMEASAGRIFLIPSSAHTTEIARVLREGYDSGDLVRGLRELIDQLALDVLIIDTHPGINEETLLSIAISHTLIVMMRPDSQDYEGTGIAIEVARQLGVPNLLLVVNKVPAVLDRAAMQAQVEQTYNCPVAAMLPHSDELMVLGSEGLFVLRFPAHPMTALYQQIADRLLV
ncbi:MAG: MinD/ParA family protein [Anaerolineae bacterium]|nr:MinD/ParA family protein [Anaerolineae bacterium]